MLFLLAMASVQVFGKIPVSNTLFYYVGAYTTILISLYFFFKGRYYKKTVYAIVIIYLVWTLICIIRGLFEIKTYWILNQFIRGIIATSSPIIIFLFATPYNCYSILRVFNRFLLAVVLILFGWALEKEANSFLLIPFYLLYVCFFFDMPQKWKWLTCLAIFLIFINLEHRSGILKTLFTIMVLIISLLPSFIRNVSYNMIHWGCYLLPFVMIYLGWAGIYNMFNPNQDVKSRYISVRYNGKPQNANDINELTQDSRTFIYFETLESAIKYDHLWIGRTPARGYSSPYFYNLFGTPEGASGIDEDERLMSEVGNLNTFSFQGIIGVIIVFFMYLWASFLALYKSHNKYVKMLAVLVAFHWAYGWVENVWNMLMVDITIMLTLSICYSPIFRNMTDAEFRLFIQDIFAKPSAPSTLELYKLLKISSIIKLSKLKSLSSYVK